MNNTVEKTPMRFQKRDGDILQTIQEYGGVMAKRQIHDLFWMEKSERAMQNRLSKLQANDYLDWPSLDQRKHNPIPEPIAWLSWKGALQVANQCNLKVDPPKSINENQLRSLELSLRKQGFRWLREPRWTQLHHDLTTIDIRMKIRIDLQTLTHLEMERWINETDFRSNFDRIAFAYKDRTGRLLHKKRGVIPDGYFCLFDKKRERKGLAAKAHFLLEVDMATHDNPSFGIEKVAAGAAYINSKEYKKRFGCNAGCWLIITTSDVRMANLMQQAKEKAGKNSSFFFFINFSDFFTNNVFLEPIWSICGQEDKQILLSQKE
jgi:hypothetical protein